MTKIYVSGLCVNEINWARKHNLDKIHLILYNNATGKKIIDKMVGFNEVIEIEKDIKKEDNILDDKIIENTDKIQLPVRPKLVDKSNSILLNLSYNTQPPEITNRVAAVGDAFGIGVDDSKEFQIFDNLKIDYNMNDLIYVTGDSGSGKSTLINLFKKDLIKKGINAVTFDDINPDGDEVVINNIGSNENEAIYYLGVVGLSEAFLMLRKFRELSQGQKYRYKLGKLISLNSDALFIDEFGATLDRVMAKVLAYCLQKWARKNNKMVVIATTHTDLNDDFNPDILVYKGFGEKTDVSYYNPIIKPISLLNYIEISEANREDYEKLENFHYIDSKLSFVKSMYKMTFQKKIFGIIAYTTPFLQVALRNKVFPEYKGQGKADKVNDEIIRIARVILHPKFRGCGLAQELVKRTMPLTNKKIVETIAAMPKYNPFFEKAGLTKVGTMKFQKSQQEIKDIIIKFGGEPSLLHSSVMRKKFLNELNPKQFQSLMNVLLKNAKSVSGMGGRGKNFSNKMLKAIQEGDIDSLLSEQLPVERVYLYWYNPNWRDN